MGKKFSHLSKTERLKIEVLLKEGRSEHEIAEYLGRHESTIYREVKRGRFLALNSDLTTEERYSPDIAEIKYRENMNAKGSCLKIGKDLKLAQYIEEKILNEHYSPAAVLGEIHAKGKEKEFSTMICVSTLYSYITKGIFLHLTNQDLPVKGQRKQGYHRIHRQPARANAGKSIEKRPDITDRSDFGNWEMDTVKGKKSAKKSLLVLTERKTRKEILLKLEEHTARAVVKALDSLERKWGRLFPVVFKTITVDNGSEFAYNEEIERSVFGEGNRTSLYYCHPYSSWERGSNEVNNKLIRRHIPKGTSFDDKESEEIMLIEQWINEYPRRIFGFFTSNNEFKKEMMKLGIEF